MHRRVKPARCVFRVQLARGAHLGDITNLLRMQRERRRRQGRFSIEHPVKGPDEIAFNGLSLGD